MVSAVWNISESIYRKRRGFWDAKLVGQFPIAFGGGGKTPTGFSLYVEGKADEKSRKTN